MSTMLVLILILNMISTCFIGAHIFMFYKSHKEIRKIYKDYRKSNDDEKKQLILPLQLFNCKSQSNELYH